MFSKKKKVKVAIFDKDLRAEIGKYEISSKGNQIRITRGGKKNFNPTFNETSYLNMPKRFGGYEPLYIVRRNAKACIDFAVKQPEITGADPDQVIEVAQAEIIKNFGKEDKTQPWWSYVLIGLQCLIILILIQ